ncbi:hypothetical protein QJQ45_014994 [Haematococcus lacustris]|nr:hypothetical protein QJQ45_014994 [Haematococcus lacustris]
MMWCPVVAPRKPPQAPRSSQEASQAAASEPGPSTPLPAKRSKRTKAEPEAAEPSQPTKGKGKGKGKAAKAKPAPQPGRWVDRDCNAALNMQRIGESKWRPLELCFWPDQRALPAKGKEYPGLGYKRLRDKPPKAQQQQPAEAQGAQRCQSITSAVTAEHVFHANIYRPTLERGWGRTLSIGKGKAAKAKPAPQPGRWVDRDCNAALNMQRIGEGKWRPLELCFWPDQGALPAKGKEYPGLGYKRLRDKPPKAQQQQQQPAEAQYQQVLVDMSLVAQCLRGSGPVPRSKSRFRLKARKNKSSELRAAHIAADHASAGPSTPPGKQRKERRAEWKTQRRQVIKVPGGAVLRGCKKTKRKLMAHFQAEPEAAEPSQPTKGTGKGKGKAAKAKPAPQPGWWVDRDCNAALNMQRIGESKWRPLELCFWPEQGKLPTKGKEYPGLGYKRLRDKPPKAQQQQPAEAQAGPSTPPGKQREERRAEWKTQRRQLEEDMAEVSMERHGRAKQLVVFFGAASIGTAGGWGADAVLRACRKVVCRPRGTDQRRGRVVLVDEHRTTRVSSAVYGQQPSWSQQRDQPVRGMMWCPVVAPRKPPQAPGSNQAASQAAASEPGPSTPLPAKCSKRTKAEPEAAEPSQPTKGTGKGKGKAAKAKPAPQPGRWVDRDCNAALNMQCWCCHELMGQMGSVLDYRECAT